MEAAGGCALIDETIRNGKGQPIFRFYLYPLLARPNITVSTGALTTRILFDGRRATGIVFQYQGKGGRSARARDTLGMATSASRRQYAHVDCCRVGDDTRIMGRGFPQRVSRLFCRSPGHDHWPSRAHSFETLPRLSLCLSELKVCCGGLPWENSPADFAYRRSPEQPAVLAAELRRACIAGPTAHGSDIFSLVSQDASCLLETKLLLILQRLMPVFS